MEKLDDMCYYERLRCYENDKRKMRCEHPEYTAKEYEDAIKQLAKKWRI